MINKKSIKLLIVVSALVTLFGVTQLRAECDDPNFSLVETERIVEYADGTLVRNVYDQCTGNLIARYYWDETNQTWVLMAEEPYRVSIGPNGNKREVVGYQPSSGGYVQGECCTCGRRCGCTPCVRR